MTWSNKFLLQCFLKLTYTADHMAPFPRDVGYKGPPFGLDKERRFDLRCELDPGYFCLYGLERPAVEHFMDTFPIVCNADESAHGSHRTRDQILQRYDEMAGSR